MKVGVVIPCFNGERFVDEAMNSVLEQQGVDLEVVLVDDGSTDGSAWIASRRAKRDSRLTVVSQENGGVAVARNVGLARLSDDVDFVLFLDADDLLNAGALMELAKALAKDKDLVAVAGAFGRMDEHGEPTVSGLRIQPFRVARSRRITQEKIPDRLDYWSMVPICPISTPGQVLIRRNRLPDPAEGLFDQRISPCEDWDLWLRLAWEGPIGVIVPEVLRYRDHSASASKAYELMRQRRTEVFRRQAEVVDTADRGRLEAAYLFGTYRWDARMCATWAREALVAGRLEEAARLVFRSFRFRRNWLIAMIRGEASRLLADPVRARTG